MAYANRKELDGRVIAAVAALQGAAIYALISGLAVDFKNEIYTPFEARNIPDEPPPQPQVVPEPQPREETLQPRFAPPVPDVQLPRADPGFTLPSTNEPLVPGELSIPDFTGAGDLIDLNPPKPEPKPEFAVQTPTLRGDAARLVGPNDYPSRDLREGNEGAVRFRLSLDARGKITGCTIEQSSGHAGLDAATCKAVSRRASFKPARDKTGAAVPGSYVQTVVWRIPD